MPTLFLFLKKFTKIFCQFQELIRISEESQSFLYLLFVVVVFIFCLSFYLFMCLFLFYFFYNLSQILSTFLRSLEEEVGVKASGGDPLQLTTPPPSRATTKPRRPARIESSVRGRPAWMSGVMVVGVVCALHCI